MKILIVGAGGIGGFVGAKLHQASVDVTFLLREQRHQLIQKQGLTVETPRGSFTIRPGIVLAKQLEPVYDLIILACKAFDLDNALSSIIKASSKGVILPLLNGFTHLDALDRQFGKERVVGGVAHIAATITAIDRDPAVIERVKALGLADLATTDAVAGIALADLVILCVPVGACSMVAEIIGPHLAQGAILSDVGSVKAAVVQAVSPHLPEHVHFIPAHPVAGTE